MEDHRWMDFQRNLSMLTNSFYYLLPEDKPQAIAAMRECLAHMQTALKQQLCSDGMRTVAAMAESLIQETYGINSNKASFQNTGCSRDPLITPGTQISLDAFPSSSHPIINDVSLHNHCQQETSLDQSPLSGFFNDSCDELSNVIYESLKNVNFSQPISSTSNNNDCSNVANGYNNLSLCEAVFGQTESRSTNLSVPASDDVCEQPLNFSKMSSQCTNGECVPVKVPETQESAELSIKAPTEDQCPKELQLCSKLQCNMCSFSSNYRQSIFRHMKTHAPAPAASSSDDQTSPLSTGNQQEILIECKDSRQFPCLLCDRRLKTRSALNEHYRYVHYQVNEAETTGSIGYQSPTANEEPTIDDCLARPFACDDCKKRFPYKKDLNRHVRLAHSDARPFSCHCGKSYKTNYHLSRHTLSQHKNKDDHRLINLQETTINGAACRNDPLHGGNVDL